MRLAWARLLGLPDEALLAPGRVEHVPAAPSTISTVRLGGTLLVTGPAVAVEAARPVPDDELTRLDVLHRLAEPLGGSDPLGAAVLAYADEHVDLPGLQDVDLGAEAALVARLREACPPADVEESALLELHPCFVLVEDHVPVAGSGYVEWAGLLAHVGVLTAPAARGCGRGLLAAAAATNDALASGLVPQWRCRADNAPSRRLAQRLGYVELGTQTTVVMRDA